MLLRLTCPGCGTVHEISPSQEGTVVRCECGQAFKASMSKKMAVSRKQENEELPGGLIPDRELVSDSLVMKKFMTETGADPEKSHWLWRYWRGFGFLLVLILFYGFTFVCQTVLSNETTCVFISLFILNLVAFGLRKAIREQSYGFWPGISIAILTLFFIYWGSIHTSNAAASILFSTPILMFLVVKRIELVFFVVGFIVNLILMALNLKTFSPLIISHLVTFLIWMAYRKGSVSQTAGKQIFFDPVKQLTENPDSESKQQKPVADSTKLSQAGPEDHTAPLPVPTLIVIEGIEQGAKFVLRQGQFAVGRGEDCDFRLSDSGISRKHGTIEYFGGKVVYKDEGSHNGSLVNDHPVTSCTLSDQDVLSIGQTKMRLEIS